MAVTIIRSIDDQKAFPTGCATMPPIGNAFKVITSAEQRPFSELVLEIQLVLAE